MAFDGQGAIEGASMGAMTGPWGALAGGVLGGLFGSSSGNSAKRQYKYQLNLQHDAQNFTKWQMANSHQMEVQDLQAAGLNPVLSAKNGSTVGGVTEGQAQMGATAPINPMEALTSLVNAKKAEAEINNLNANTTKQKKEGAKTESEKKLIDIKSEIEPQIAKAQIRLNNAQSAKAKQEIDESLSREFINDINQQIRTIELKHQELDWEKRKKLIDTEIELYKKEIENALIEAGYDQTEVGLIIKSIGKSVNAISPLTPYTGRPESQRPVYNHNNYYTY